MIMGFRSILVTVSVLFLIPSFLSGAYGQTASPPKEKAENYIALSAKLLCSGIFVSGRSQEDVIKNDLAWSGIPGFPTWDQVKVSVDQGKKSVTLGMEGIPSRTAVFNGDQGCTLLPREGGEVFFKPVRLDRGPGAAEGKWPMGDSLDDRPLPPEIDEGALNAAMNFAFDESLQARPQKTRALLVLYKRRIIAERYAPGFDRNSRHISWSMGKSITAALIGILAQRGELRVDEVAPVPEWRSSRDPRRGITISDLMQMSSGLKFRSGAEELPIAFTEKDQHTYVYFAAPNVFQYSVNNELESPPGTVWKYRNCDPLVLGKIVRDKVEARGEEYLSFPHRALFSRIGMRNVVLETDRWGNFIMTGYDYLTARDWARFALLHLQDGVWQGERILPRGWIQQITRPAPANKNKEYGSLFWLNAGKKYKSLPEDMYWPMGHHGQVAMIIPSREIAVVRLGIAAKGGFDAYAEQVMQRVLASIKTPAK